MTLSIKFPDTKKFTIVIPGSILRTTYPNRVLYEAGYLQCSSIVSHFPD